VLKDFSTIQGLVDAGATIVGAPNAAILWQENVLPPIG
jgi:hypothetical protein